MAISCRILLGAALDVQHLPHARRVIWTTNESYVSIDLLNKNYSHWIKIENHVGSIVASNTIFCIGEESGQM